MKIGDPVEFEMTYDRRTGKPIASTVTKIAPEVVSILCMLKNYYNFIFVQKTLWVSLCVL